MLHYHRLFSTKFCLFHNITFFSIKYSCFTLRICAKVQMFNPADKGLKEGNTAVDKVTHNTGETSNTLTFEEQTLRTASITWHCAWWHDSHIKILSDYTVRTFGDIFSARQIPVGTSTYQEHSTVIWTFNSLLTENTNFLHFVKMTAQLSLCLIKHHATKPRKEVEVQLQSFAVVSFTYHLHYPEEKYRWSIMISIKVEARGVYFLGHHI